MQLLHKWILTAAVTIMVAVLASQPLIAGQSPLAPTLNPMHGPAIPVASLMYINAVGQARGIGNGNNGPLLNATLLLNGTMSTNNGGQIKINDITGTLQIGNQTYTLVSGNGVENGHGDVEIEGILSTADLSPGAQTSTGQELILHGTIQGNTIMFTSPQSKLASLYFLSLQGTVTLSTTTTTSTTSSTSSSTTSNSTTTTSTISNSTSTASTNSTITQTTNSTTTNSTATTT